VEDEEQVVQSREKKKRKKIEDTSTMTVGVEEKQHGDMAIQKLTLEIRKLELQEKIQRLRFEENIQIQKLRSEESIQRLRFVENIQIQKLRSEGSI
jgi:hypothetical protein